MSLKYQQPESEFAESFKYALIDNLLTVSTGPRCQRCALLYAHGYGLQ